MGDCDVVGVASSRRLDVPGVRVPQSFSRGEVWLLKQLLLSVHNQERARELVRATITSGCSRRPREC